MPGYRVENLSTQRIMADYQEKENEAGYYKGGAGDQWITLSQVDVKKI